MLLTVPLVLGGIIAALWLEHLWDVYLSIRQYNILTKTTKIPNELRNVMTKEVFDKARTYNIDKTKFGWIKGTISIIVATGIIYYGIFGKVWRFAEQLDLYEGEVAVSCTWLFLIIVMQTILDLPFTFYYNFVLEEKYGFNKQTVQFFIIDKVKSFILSMVLTLPITAIVILIVKYGGEYFFLWLWISVGIITMVLLTIYPSYIAPRFDKYTPLPEGELRVKIEKLAKELQFPLTELYVVEGSKRSSHSNAYFYGLFKSKRIVLFDTLLQNDENGGCQEDEIIAILSHELGHWYHNHVAKNLLINQINMFLMFLVFSLTFKYPLIYQAVGFEPTVQPILIGLIVVAQFVLMPYNSLLSFLITCLSRQFEYQADGFAMGLKRAEPLRRALIKLNKDNLGFPVYDTWYSAWHHSHPALLDRLGALEKDV